LVKKLFLIYFKLSVIFCDVYLKYCAGHVLSFKIIVSLT